MPGTVKADLLFLGLTRPPMLFGVSYTFAILNSMICMIAYIISSDFRFLASLFPIHAVGYYICAKEPLFIELFKVKGEKCSRRMNTHYHGANSYDIY
ncbi:MAG: VirB3 family type IV secretion system protein [Candidatus Lariskella arthropodorum]